MGLVVVPGEYIERIEVEEFESQVKGKMKIGGQMLVKSQKAEVEGKDEV
jgi:hypothetical protein